MADVMEMEATDLGDAEPVEQTEDIPETEDAPEPEPEEDEQSEDDAEESEEEPAEEAKAEPVKQDGRNMPDAVKKAFANLKTSNPEAAKTLRATWFQNQDYKAAFATPADAVALKNQYEEIGGAEGIKQIQEERQEWSEIDKAVAEGRAAELLAHNPEVLTKNAVGVINEWAKVASDQYGYYTNTVAVNTLAKAGITTDALADLHKAYADNPQAQAIIADIHNRIVDIREKTQQFEQKRTDPAQEKLKQDRERFETERRGDFEGRVAGEAETYLGTAVDRAIGALLNGRKADADQMDIYRDRVMREVEKRLGQIPGFGDSLEAHYRTGNRQNSVDFIKKQYDRILTSGKAANVIDPLLRNINPQKAVVKEKAAARTTEAGTVNLPEMPDWDKIDWNRTTTQEYASGKAVLVNGKQARW